MKPETADALAAADRALANAHSILLINIPDQAARLAYYGQFNAAQAYIFESTGKVFKTHKGVHKQFHRLSRGDAALPPGLAAQLNRAYLHKESADYDTGVTSAVTATGAKDAIAIAQRFTAAVRQALEPEPSVSP